MYLMNLFAQYWMIIGVAAVSLWILTDYFLPRSGQRNDDETCRARAQRAAEYQRLRRMELPK